MKEYLSNHRVFITVDERDLSGEGVDGWCIKETENEFLIQIDENLEYDYIPTLLHELYHVYQHMNNLPRDEYETHCQESKLLDKYWNKD
jgi:hypothetical protein